MTRMRRLRGLSLRYARQRAGRAALTAVGVTLGTAILFAALVTMASFDRGFDELVDGFVGDADVVATPVGGMDATVPEKVAAQLRANEDVDLVAAGFGFSSAVGTLDDPDLVSEDSFSHFGLRVFGVDAAATRLYPFRLRGGRSFASGAPEAVIPEQLARRLDRGVGEVVVVATPRGRAELRVVGVVGGSGAARYNDGDVVYTSVATARRLAGEAAVINLLGVRLAPAVDAAGWLESHGEGLDPRLLWQPATEVMGPLRSAVRAFGSTLTVLAAMVLFVGAFLIYLTLTMAVAERRRTIGILRALGASRAAVHRLVLTEALAVGAAGTAVGMIAGAGLAKVLVTVTESGPNALPSAGVVILPGAVVAVVVLGVGATAVSALEPARRAAAVDPIVAIRESQHRGAHAARLRPASVVLVGLGVALPLGGGSGTAVTVAALLLMLLGSVLLVPAALPVLVRLVTAGRGSRGGMGRVVAPHLLRERTRSAYTLALAMVAMAMATALGATQASFSRTAERQLEAQFGADLELTAASNFAPAFVEELRGRPEVAAVTPVWWGWSEVVDLGDRATRVRVIDPATHFDVTEFAWVEGDSAGARRQLVAGDSALLPESVARDLDVGRGDSVALATTEGVHRFLVAGIYASVGSSRSADGFSAVVVGASDGRAWFGIGQPVALEIEVASGHSPGVVGDLFEQRFGDRTAFVVATAAEQKDVIHGQLRQLTGLLATIVVAASLVAGLGLANTLAVSMLERTREIGVLRAIGAFRRQVRTMAVLESATLVATAAVLALPLGALLSVPVVRLASESFGAVLA